MRDRHKTVDCCHHSFDDNDCFFLLLVWDNASVSQKGKRTERRQEGEREKQKRHISFDFPIKRQYLYSEIYYFFFSRSGADFPSRNHVRIVIGKEVSSHKRNANTTVNIHWWFQEVKNGFKYVSFWQIHTIVDRIMRVLMKSNRV